MAAIELPDLPGPAAVAWRQLDFGGTLQGPLGGAAQRVNRLGNRWRVEVTMPALTPAQAREWSSALTRGVRLGVIWRIRQVGTPTGSPGSPLVAGADQTGESLDVDGLNVGYTYRTGQFLSILTVGRRYVHQLAASGRIGATGAATLAIDPALRTSPADDAVIELAVPKIEGLLAEAPTWSLDPDRLARGFGFAIEEAR